MKSGKPDGLPESASSPASTSASTARNPVPAITEAETGALEQEAIAYIRDITAREMEPVTVDDADNFVRSTQTISLIPDGAVELKSMEEILSDPSIHPESPITVVRETEQIVMSTPKRLIQQAGGNLQQKIRILEDDQVRELSIAELRQQYSARAEVPISVVQTAEHIEIITAAELQNEQSLESGQKFKVITRPYHLDSTTIGELLLVNEADAEDSVFYVRSVKSPDSQGIWGIVQAGLIDNFARGIAIRRGQEINHYQVDIPRDADEVQSNRSSSFLGRLIHEKTLQSYVYNHEQGRMGRNPHLILPGQEIVIIRFSNDELINIYKHFVSRD
jgi:hypothetical protein